MELNVSVLTIGERRFTPAIKFVRPKFRFVSLAVEQEKCSRTGKPLYALPGGGRATEDELRKLYGVTKGAKHER